MKTDTGANSPKNQAVTVAIDQIQKQFGKGSIMRLGETPIGNVEVIKLLIAAGAKIDAQDNNGMQPIHSAAKNDNKNAVEFFINNGADINAKTKDGETSLMLAEKSGRKDIVKYLKQ